MSRDIEDEIRDEKNPRPLDEDDIALLKTYGLGPYSAPIKKVEKEIKDLAKRINDLCGIKESDTGLAPPSQWDLVSDKQMMQEEQPLQVARCTKIISPNTEDAKYVINVKQIAKFVVGLGDKVSPTDIEEGMRVGVDRNKYQIQIPLPPKIDPSVTMMTVEEKPDVTYNDVGGCKEQIEKMREVVELPMLHPEKFVKLGIDPPKGVLCYGPPGTGKTLLARAVANRTDACFIRVIGSELVQKYVGEGARMVRELFQMARSKKACIVFFDEVDAIGGARFDDGVGGDNEVQRTMLEIVNQLDGFDARGNIKVLMATNRPDTLDPALLRPGRLDRKVEFGLPDLESRTQIFKIHTRTMNCERDIRFELLARLCPNSTGNPSPIYYFLLLWFCVIFFFFFLPGADIRSVCTEAGMYAIRARRKTVTEKDFLDAVNKVIKGDILSSQIWFVLGALSSGIFTPHFFSASILRLKFRHRKYPNFRFGRERERSLGTMFPFERNHYLSCIKMSVIIGTTVGDLLIDLFIEKCPKTCLNFLKLCKIKYYHNYLFHTVNKDSIAVTGDPTGTGTGGDSIFKLLDDAEGEQFFDNEIHPDLNHFGNGQYGSKSECISVFGVVVDEGRDTMSQLKESSVNKEHRPYKPIMIIGMEIIDDPFDDPPKLAQLIPVSTDEEGDSVSTGGSTDEEHELRVCLWNQKLKGSGPYSAAIKKVEKEVEDLAKKINYLCDTDTGLAPSSQWDLASDKRMIKEEICTSVISPNTPDAQYVISFKQRAKFAVGLGDKVSPSEMQLVVGLGDNKYQIQIPLPPKIDHRVTMMTVEEKPDVTCNDVGGCKEQIEKIRAVVELPMLHPEKFVKLGIDPPKGVLCYGPPGTGKTLLARAVANRTDACFIRVIGSELVQKYVGEGARMVRELFQMARSKKACIVFFDEVDAIGGARFDDGVGGDNEVQRTMLEIVNQLDGFDARGNIKVLMATNRPDTLDPALLRPGRLDRKVEFGLPDLESRTQIFKIHTRTMNCERDIRFELLARLCPNSTGNPSPIYYFLLLWFCVIFFFFFLPGADIRSVCTEAGMYAIRARRKTVTEKDFLDAVNKVIKGYQKFSATPKYMPHYV
ncbi:hypothetical protein YC2023_076785 [Brassica napus]